MTIRYFRFILIFIFAILSCNLSAQNNEELQLSDENNQEEMIGDSFSDEFDEFNENTDEFTEYVGEEVPVVEAPVSYNRAFWAIAILIFTILAGILVKFKATRNLRAVFLLLSIVFLGFYRGGPGVISSFQNTYLFFVGLDNNWQAIILFLGLIPITYFFGRVFCGWLCYLGALQEFLYIGRIKIFQTEKAQKIMRIIRYVVLGILIIQLSFTQTILWNKIGPFRVAFNLFSPNITGYVLLGILLITSLFIYRPFCKAICPVGLLLGLITKIPGASIIGINDSCSGCKTCNTSCKINAITRDDKVSKLDNQECIMCGDCLSDCKTDSNNIYRKLKQHYDKIKLKSDK
ncbi:MAG: 4Fe-4S binding protein [Bacteroidales bacterium]|nr:4Fe-4S binding protein [Bacteroidales bacterium]